MSNEQKPLYGSQFPEHGKSTADHDKDIPTKITVSAYYRVAQSDRQKFIDAVIPDVIAAKKIPGCIYYAFAADLIDPTLFHLTEGWRDEAAYNLHESSPIFLNALKTVVETVKILDRQGVQYEVAKILIDDPRYRVE